MPEKENRIHYFRRGLSALVRKEFIQILRDVRLRGLVFIAPILQLLVFGYAVNFDIHNIPLAVVDYDHSSVSRGLVSALDNTVYFSTVAYPENLDQSMKMMESGEVRAVLVIPEGLNKHLGRGEIAQVEIWADGSDANEANVAVSYATAIINNYSSRIVLEALSAKGGVTTFAPRFQVWYNPALASTVFMIPGVICLILTVISTNLTASAIVRERERGTLEQVMVTPLSRLQFILGKLIPYIVISFIDITVVITLGMLIFSVPMRGSFLLLYLCAALFLLTSLGIGLFISTISRTQQQAMLSSIFFTFPAITLSGFMYPINNMPKIFQYINCVNPLRWFIEILRGIMLKGNGIDVLWPQILALSAIGFSIITLSVMRFQKRIG